MTASVAAEVAAALRRHGVSGVDDSAVARAMYSSDASLFRVVPQAVVKPAHTEELLAVHEVSRTLGVPVTLRGSGTSIAGNAIGPGIVIDTRSLCKVRSVDPETRTAVVQPGVVHADLQRVAARHGLRFGPDPSTHSRCTIGGMIGNNACGSRALGYGRTVDNIEALDVLFGNGHLARYGGRERANADATADSLLAVAEENLSHIRTTFGRFGRQVSGYSLEHLLPEKRRRIDRFLAGTEGTLAIVLEATVRLVPDDHDRRLLLLGYPSMVDAADAVPALLATAPKRIIACEGIDSRIVDLVRSTRGAVPQLPRGNGWMMIEVAGEGAAEVVEKLTGVGSHLECRQITDPAEAAALWRIREDGAGLAGRSLGGPAYSGWEDAAVPPAHLGAWLRDFEEILSSHGLQGIPYGHFGDGCIHSRIDFPFTAGAPSSVAVFRDFMLACATKLRDYGGSLSGEHGDGRARSALLPLMYDETSIALFAQVKRICDPDGLLNPGVIVDPAPFTADLRPLRSRSRPATGLRLLHDGGDLGAALHRCTGVGKCVAPQTTSVMCPSYLATGNETHSTRGRSRVLQEALDGELVHGLADPAVTEALDLCLACKGCSTDCPSGVDMAAYKSEALHQKYAGRLRPRSHYALGRLPRWARMAASVGGLANASLRVKLVARLAKVIAGVDQRRSLPELSPATLRKQAATARAADTVPDLWIWADSFTNHFFPRSALAAIKYFETHGLCVKVVEDEACCALTWVTTGQLDQARIILTRSVQTLSAYVDSGVPVVVLEPSCLATLRSDSLELVDLPLAQSVARGLMTFAEAVAALDLPLPDLSGVEVVAQPHCHQSAVLGWSVDEALLKEAGATVTKVAGCCGLAGNFGVEKGHYEVSRAVAETHLLPAVRANPHAVILADGMSCRVQLDDLAAVPTMHLAELFASRLAPEFAR